MTIAVQSIAKAGLQCFGRSEMLPRVRRPKNDDQITFRLPASEKRDLKAAAEKRSRAHNWLARDIVLKWLAKERRRRKA